jgi:hypothetical protein
MTGLRQTGCHKFIRGTGTSHGRRRHRLGGGGHSSPSMSRGRSPAVALMGWSDMPTLLVEPSGVDSEGGEGKSVCMASLITHVVAYLVPDVVADVEGGRAVETSGPLC